MEVNKKEVEDLLGCEISEELFTEALAYAKKKQASSYDREQRQVIKEHWYLVKLTEECARALAFARFTQELCEVLNSIEKERQVKDRSTPTNNYIVPQPAVVNQ